MSILSTTGAITKIDPLPNVKNGKEEHNKKIFMFQERENFRLPSDVYVDISLEGTYPDPESKGKRWTPEPETTQNLIPAGTPVDSYFLHFDVKGTSDYGIRRKGSVTFDEKILGVIVDKDRHNDTWSILGNPGTQYAIKKRANTELNDKDKITWEGNKLDVSLITFANIDQIRVITEHSVPPTLTSFRLNGSNSNITIPEGNSVLAQLEATDPNRDTIDFFLSGPNIGNGRNIGTDFRESGTRAKSTSLGVFPDNGTFTYRGQARDNDGQSSSTIARTVTVINVTPNLSFRLSSNVINEGQSASAILSATDPGADAISFYLDNQLIRTDFRTSGTREASTDLGPFQNDGTFTFSARSRDDDGRNSNTITQTLTVNNVAPTINSLTEDLTIRIDKTFSFAATATDPGLTDILVYEWDLDGDGQYDDFTGSSGEWSFSEPGDHEVKLRVSDGDGGVDENSFTVTAEPNQVEPYSFRFTDIKAVSDDPEGNEFQFSFEILNWSDTPAAGIEIAINEDTNQVQIDAPPEFAGGTVDSNRDPITGNLNLPNNSTVSEEDNTSIKWNLGDPLLNRDVLGPATNAEACQLIPGCDLLSGEPHVSDIEAIDDGDNVRDGFVFNVDNWDEGEILILNWFLKDENGDNIGTADAGNKNGSGIVQFYRSALVENNNPDALFGVPDFIQPSELFYNNVNRVTEFA